MFALFINPTGSLATKRLISDGSSSIDDRGINSSSSIDDSGINNCGLVINDEMTNGMIQVVSNGLVDNGDETRASIHQIDVCEEQINNERPNWDLNCHISILDNSNAKDNRVSNICLNTNSLADGDGGKCADNTPCHNNIIEQTNLSETTETSVFRDQRNNCDGNTVTIDSITNPLDSYNLNNIEVDNIISIPALKDNDDIQTGHRCRRRDEIFPDYLDAIMTETRQKEMEEKFQNQGPIK